MRRRKTPQKNLSIVGVITPAFWDDNGTMTGVSIQGTDEVEYVVRMDATGSRLMALVRKRIQAEGTILKHMDEKPVVKITAYDVLDC